MYKVARTCPPSYQRSRDNMFSILAALYGSLVIHYVCLASCSSHTQCMKCLYRCTDCQCSFLMLCPNACMFSGADCSVLWSHYSLSVCHLFFTLQNAFSFLCTHPECVIICKGYMFSVLLAQSLSFFQDKMDSIIC